MARRTALALSTAITLAIVGLGVATAAPSQADPNPPEVSSIQTPTCSRVAVGHLTYRLLFAPNGVIDGKVTSVRSGRVEFAERPNGTWIGTVKVIEPRMMPNFHIVTKSRSKVGGRTVKHRFSAFYVCSPAQP